MVLEPVEVSTRQNRTQAQRRLHTGRHSWMGRRGESDLSGLTPAGSLRLGSALKMWYHVSEAGRAQESDTD